MKVCTKCNEPKENDYFWKDKRRVNGLQAKCILCRKGERRTYQSLKGPELNAKARAKYGSNPWRDRHRHLVRKYGIGEAEYQELLSEQGGCCAICRIPSNKCKNSVLCVDHCHTTKKVRGLLCFNCNSILGLANDRPEVLKAAIEYIIPQVAAEFIEAYVASAECK